MIASQTGKIEVTYRKRELKRASGSYEKADFEAYFFQSGATSSCYVEVFEGVVSNDRIMTHVKTSLPSNRILSFPVMSSVLIW